MPYKPVGKIRTLHSFPPEYREIVEMIAERVGVGEDLVLELDTLSQQISFRTNLYRYFKAMRDTVDRWDGKGAEPWCLPYIGAIDKVAIFGVEGTFNLKIGKKSAGKMATILRRELDKIKATQGTTDHVTTVVAQEEGREVSIAEMKRMMRERGMK